MAIRTINYTVTSGGIEPATLQAGGVQGEHNATLLRFKIEDGLWEKLKRKKDAFEGSQLIYRFDGVDGVGNVHPSDVTVLDEQTVEYYLERCVTKYGGKVKVTLVITLYKNSASKLDLHSCSADLQLKASPVHCAEHEEGETISALAYGAKESLAQAEAAAKRAEYAKAQTKDAAVILEEGSEVVFLGGDAQSGFKVSLKVDSSVIKESPNPVAGGAVFAELEGVKSDINYNVGELKKYAEEKAGDVEVELKELIGAATIKEVGSYEVTGNKIVPFDSENAPGSNKWNYIILNNGFYICYGHFNIKPDVSSNSGINIYLSEQITVPLPFTVYVNTSTATGASTNQTELNNLYIGPNSVTFNYRRCNAGIPKDTTRTFLQVIGMVADINSFKEAESDE